MQFSSILRIVGSLKFAAVVLVLLAVAMACATVYEAMHGTPAALTVFYKSAWFEGMLWLLAANLIASMLSRYPWSRRHVGFLLTHASLLLILGGALVTKNWGIDGRVSVAEGDAAREFSVSGADALTLRKEGTSDGLSLDLIGGIGGTSTVERPVTGTLVAGDLSVSVDRYIPDGQTVEQVVDDGERPQLALQVQTTGGGQQSTAWVFAGEPPSSSRLPIALRVVADAAELERTLSDPASRPAEELRNASTMIQIVAGPGGRLAARFNPELRPSVGHELTLGGPVETPWAGLQFAVLQRYEHARREATIEPVDPPREDREPALLLSLRQGGQARQVWLPRNASREVTLGDARYALAYDDKYMPLGFELRLNKFHLGTYPGSRQPRSFESHVTVVDAGGAEQNRIISMNNPAKFGSYSLFQSSYHQGRNGVTTSVLSVSWDPGLPMVFAGYILLIVGMLYVLVLRVGKRRSEDGEPAASAPVATYPKIINLQRPGPSACLVLALLGTAALVSAPARAQAAELPGAQLDLSVVRALPVQHDGRWMPLDTLARDEVETVTGTAQYRGKDAVAWLLAWTFDPQTWASEPLISIRSAELRAELKLPAERSEFSFNELAEHQPLRDLIDELSQRGARGKMNPLESKVSDINRRLVELRDVFRNQVIRPIPDPAEHMGAWQPIELPAAGRPGTAPRTPAQLAWQSLGAAFLHGDAESFAKAARQLQAELSKLPSAHRVEPAAVDVELRYNRLQPYGIAWKIMVLGAVLAAIAVGANRRWTDALAIAALMTGFAVLTYGMWMRWQIAGRIPAANMFESLLFLSWGAGAFAIVSMLVVKDRLVTLTASFIGSLALFLADFLPIDSFIRPIAPVLMDTVWMSIHVPGIMISYAVLALAMLIAHAQLVAMALVPQRRTLVEKLDLLHYWYVHVGTILLGAGIITGSMWAASSWGRYWGWDPKEVWSLIAFLAYLVILHVRTDREVTPAWIYGVGLVLAAGLFIIVVPKLAPLSALKVLALAGGLAAAVLFVVVRGRFATAVKSAVAFWFIIMTYVGVNYVLGIGLHSYGFGTGAVVKYMMLTGSIDLGLVALLTAIYLGRKRLAI